MEAFSSYYSLAPAGHSNQNGVILVVMIATFQSMLRCMASGSAQFQKVLQGSPARKVLVLLLGGRLLWIVDSTHYPDRAAHQSINLYLKAFLLAGKTQVALEARCCYILMLHLRERERRARQFARVLPGTSGVKHQLVLSYVSGTFSVGFVYHHTERPVK